MEKQQRFQNLVNAYSKNLYQYAYWLCREPAAAEDLVQETFLRAWRGLDNLANEQAAKSWLITILRNENARKYEKKQLEYSDTPLEQLPAPDNTAIKPETLALHQALKQLPAIFREPLVLQMLEGYTMNEIAQLLDLPANTVATRLYRARQKLRHLLQDGFSEYQNLEVVS